MWFVDWEATSLFSGGCGTLVRMGVANLRIYFPESRIYTDDTRLSGRGSTNRMQLAISKMPQLGENTSAHLLSERDIP